MTNNKWILDTTHSSVDFTVKHMMFAKVNGSFTQFGAEIEANALDLTTAKLLFTISTTSVDTNNEDRDNHLRGSDFFDVENFPQATFKSTEIVSKGDGEYLVTGEFTLRGVTKTETFNVSFEGQGKDPWGNTKAAFSVKGKINRSDYGLVWNAALETGGVLVSDEVKISIQIQAVLEA